MKSKLRMGIAFSQQLNQVVLLQILTGMRA